MTYYKPLENLNVVDLVRFKSIGQAESGRFGKQHQCSVDVNGTDMTWTLSEKKHADLTKAGFGQGSSVIIQKWKEGVKKGYNFVKPNVSDAGKAFDEVFHSLTPTQQFEKLHGDPATISGAPRDMDGVPPPPAPPKDVIGERIIKGMCLNGACRLYSGQDVDKGKLLETSKWIYDEMKEWLTN